MTHTLNCMPAREAIALRGCGSAAGQYQHRIAAEWPVEAGFFLFFEGGIVFGG
jgi:hypothetical protein